MEERDEILIGRYLANELSEKEKVEVDLRMKDDPFFRQEVMAYEAAKEALRARQREELKQRFLLRDEELDKKDPISVINRSDRTMWIWMAAALVVTIIVWKLLSSDHQQTAPAEPGPADTIQINQFPPLQNDTIDGKDSLRNQKQNIKTTQEKPDMAEDSKRGIELFAEYFEPYKDAMMDPLTRGNKELSPFQKYQKAYWDGDYQQTVELFAQLPPNYQVNDNFRFSYANALLKTGKTAQAILILESIINNNQSTYWTESHLTLAFAYLQQGQMNKSTQLVAFYIASEKAMQKKEAKDLNHLLNQ